MSTQWYVDFLQRLREFRTHCADALHDADERSTDRINTQPISRAVEALERHWKKQFPLHTLPHRNDIDRHLRIGQIVDVLDLMTKDVHDAEVKALSALGDTRTKPATPFVAGERIEQLTALASDPRFDFTRLLRLCEELNIVSEKQCHISTAILVRALIDHVPPIFDKRSFPEVVSNYAGTKSFLASAKHLEESSRKIADGLLHSHIRKTESLPTATQVDFRQSLDVLLGEVARLHIP